MKFACLAFLSLFASQLAQSATTMDPRPKGRDASYSCSYGHPVPHYLDWDGDGFLEKIPTLLCDSKYSSSVDWGDDPVLYNRWIHTRWFKQPILVSDTLDMQDYEFDCDPGSSLLYQRFPVLGIDIDNDGIPAKTVPSFICSGQMTEYSPGFGSGQYDRLGMAVDWRKINQMYYNTTRKGPVQGILAKMDRYAIYPYSFAGGGQWAWAAGIGYDPIGLADCDDKEASIPYHMVMLDSDADGYPENVNQRYYCTEPQFQTARWYVEYTTSTVNGELQRPTLKPQPLIKDCAPKDPTSFAAFKYFTDYDADGFGADYIDTKEICIDDTVEMLLNGLPKGYAKMGGDCNDGDKNVTGGCSISFDQQAFESRFYSKNANAIVVESKNDFQYLAELTNYVKLVGYSGFSVSGYCDDCLYSALRIEESYLDKTAKLNWKASVKDGGYHNFTLTLWPGPGKERLTISFRVLNIANTTVGFLNGIMNEVTDAQESTDRLTVVTPPDVTAVFAARNTSSNVLFENLYNPTDGLSSDLRELFYQKVADLARDSADSADAEATRRFLLDGAEDNITAATGRILEAGSLKVKALALKVFINHVDGKRKSFVEKTDHSDFDATTFVNQIEKAVRSGSRYVIVSHSQGNLFSNDVYRKLSPLAQQLTRQVQVAPITNQSVDGLDTYVLNNRDIVYTARLTTRGYNTTVRDFCDSLLSPETAQKTDEVLSAVGTVTAGLAMPVTISAVQELNSFATLYHAFNSCYLDPESLSVGKFSEQFKDSLNSINP